MRVYMKSKWYDDIDFIQIEASANCLGRMELDTEHETRTMTFTDGLLFRKFPGITPTPQYYRCHRCGWRGSWEEMKNIPKGHFHGRGCPVCESESFDMTNFKY